MNAKHIFLAISLTAFVIGFSDKGESIFWDLGRPMGAIFLILFMIFNLLEKESALSDDRTKNKKQTKNNLRDGKSSMRSTDGMTAAS